MPPLGDPSFPHFLTASQVTLYFPYVPTLSFTSLPSAEKASIDWLLSVSLTEPGTDQGWVCLCVPCGSSPASLAPEGAWGVLKEPSQEELAPRSAWAPFWFEAVSLVEVWWSS